MHVIKHIIKIIEMKKVVTAFCFNDKQQTNNYIKKIPQSIKKLRINIFALLSNALYRNQVKSLFNCCETYLLELNAYY